MTGKEGQSVACPDKEENGKPGKKALEDRRAEALRSNLRRRKDQSQARNRTEKGPDQA